MKQFIPLFISAFFAIANVSAQETIVNTEEGYYVKNNAVKSGIFFERTNEKERAERLIIPNQKRHEATVFFPSDIEEYGFPDRQHYVSAEINLHGNLKKVFLEEVIRIDSIIVYYYPDRKEDLFYFQKIDGTLELMQNEEAFLDLLRNADCPEIIAFVDSKRKKKLNRKTINVYSRAYSDCNTNLLPSYHFGITTETGILKPGSNKYQNFSYDLSFSFLIGIFAQIPLDECFSFRPEILYSYIDNPKGQISGLKAYKRESIQFPVVFRYNFNHTKGNIIPYIDLGPLLDLKTSKESGTILGSRFPLEGENDWNTLANSEISLLQYGVVLGGGIEYKLNRRNSIYAGLRFKYVEGSGVNESIERLKYFSLNIAYGF
jgi:hypothetical protein